MCSDTSRYTYDSPTNSCLLDPLKNAATSTHKTGYSLNGGGNDFGTDTCSTGYLMGFKVKAERSMDAISIICNQNGSTVPKGVWHGTEENGTDQGNTVCATGWVHAIGVHYGNIVNTVDIYCASSTASYNFNNISATTGGDAPDPDASTILSCPSPYRAVGIIGYSATSVDKLGLVCGIWN